MSMCITVDMRSTHNVNILKFDQNFNEKKNEINVYTHTFDNFGVRISNV